MQRSVLRRIGLLSLLAVLLPSLLACGGETVTVEPIASATGPTTIVTALAATALPATEAPAITTDVAVTPAVADTAAVSTEGPVATEAPAATEVPATAAPVEAPTAAIAPTAAAMFETRSTLPERLPAFGVVSHLYYVDRTTVLEQARAGGFEWVRQQVPWKDTERADRGLGTEELDRIVDSVNASGRKLLLSLVKSPEFLTSGPGDTGLPNDPADFGRFAGLIAERYKGRVHAIEVWNEQNLAVENGGKVVPEDAGHYVEVLKAGYTAIKAVDPNIIVVAGAPSSTGVTQPDLAVDDLTYLQAMYTYNNGEARSYFDVQGFHPASTLNAPDLSYPDNLGPVPEGCPGSCWKDAPTHFFRHIENFIQIMHNSGMGDKPIWITEMGWATQNTTPGYEYGNFVSDEQQAAYLTGALNELVFRYDKWVTGVFIWNLNFGPLWAANGDPLHEQAAFGLIAPDGSPRPAYTAVQEFITTVEAGQVPQLGGSQ